MPAARSDAVLDVEVRREPSSLRSREAAQGCLELFLCPSVMLPASARQTSLVRRAQSLTRLASAVGVRIIFSTAAWSGVYSACNSTPFAAHACCHFRHVAEEFRSALTAPCCSAMTHRSRGHSPAGVVRLAEKVMRHILHALNAEEPERTLRVESCASDLKAFCSGENSGHFRSPRASRPCLNASSCAIAHDGAAQTHMTESMTRAGGSCTPPVDAGAGAGAAVSAGVGVDGASPPPRYCSKYSSRSPPEARVGTRLCARRRQPERPRVSFRLRLGRGRGQGDLLVQSLAGTPARRAGSGRGQRYSSPSRFGSR